MEGQGDCEYDAVMKRAAVVREIRPVAGAPNPRLRSVPSPEPRRPSLATARVHEIGESGVLVSLGGALATATLDPSVSPVVIEGACARGERVLVEEGADGELVVLGALRAQPTPGIDVAEDYAIRAKRVSIEAEEEISLGAQAAALVLRAAGEVETYADRIVSRAESVHKIIGRMLRLN
jgi:hypothetical protein